MKNSNASAKSAKPNKHDTTKASAHRPVRPTEFLITETDDLLVSQSGLALVGALLATSSLRHRLNDIVLPGKPRPTTAHADVIMAMIGLLCLGKSDFADIEAFRDDAFFPRALGLECVPSEPTLRQRMAELSHLPHDILSGEILGIIRAHAPALTPCFKDWLPLDIDVSPFDNSNTKKEGVGWTYKQVDGFAPIFAYLGAEGYLVHEQLREGTQHCQKNTPAFITRAIANARLVTDGRILVRLDSGNDAEETLEACRNAKADFIIKRNLRRESKDEWLEIGMAYGDWREPREGKRVFVGDMHRTCGERLWRVVFEVTERTVTADGQVLLIPDIEVATYWTSLGERTATPDGIIALYRDHGTSEQFHSEVKTDLDLERLPSGKFAVNALVLTCGMAAYNLLRLIGQRSLAENRHLPPEDRMPIRKAVHRRRLRSVIQDLMYLAGRLVRHARRWGLAVARMNPWGRAWRATYRSLLHPDSITPGTFAKAG